jgi:TolB-like protein
MTLLTSFSSKAALIGCAALLLTACAGSGGALRTGHAVKAGGLRVAVLPVNNLSGGPVPLKEVRGMLEDMCRGMGMEVVSDERVEKFMAAHRIRYTGGINSSGAGLFKDELGVDMVLVSSMELYSPTPPPKVAACVRLVSTGPEPRIAWIDEFSLAGDDSPGILGLGLIDDPVRLMKKGVDKLAASAAASISGSGKILGGCAVKSKYRPKVSYLSDSVDMDERHTVAVLPFLNNTDRDNAGEIVALDFVDQLWRSGRFEVVEPGVVRDSLLRYRIILEGGVSLANAEAVLDILKADMVLAGNVMDYEDYQGSYGKPKVGFSSDMIDRRTKEVVWESRSYNEGDDCVFFFDAGRVNTAEAMSCGMAGSVVKEMTTP